MLSDLYFGDLFVKDKNNYIYCVDMLRVTCDIPYQVFEDKILSHLIPLMKHKDAFPYVEEFSKYGFGGFKYNYAIHLDDGVTIYLGYMSNQELACEGKGVSNPNTKWNCTIEFNPNKVEDSPLLMNILRHNWGWIIKSCDIACDIPFNIKDLDILKNPKNLLTIFEKYGIKTYILGVAPNRIKIYDKKFEANLDYDLTRIEFSKVLDMPLMNYKNFFFDLKVPSIALKEYQVDLNDLSIDSTLKAIIYAVEHGFSINDLSRRYKEKVVNYQMKKSPIEFDPGSFNKTFINYIEYYFSNLVI